jgi:hypothetical protein
MPLCATCGPVVGAIHPVKGCQYHRELSALTEARPDITPAPSVTETPRVTVIPRPISVTEPVTPSVGVEPGHKPGRPKKQDALSAADRQRAYRERRKAGDATDKT